MKIHPTALVDPAARLGQEVEIGPYAVIGPEVEIGARSIVQSHAVLEGSVRLGKDNFVGHGAIIGAFPQDLSFQAGTRSAVEIGDDNVLREYVTIHRGTAPDSTTHIGHENFLMAGAHVGHNCRLGNKIIIANDCLLAGYVTVENNAFLGGGCVFHQFIRVGRLAMTQGNSAFSKDVPPFVVATGLNQVVGLNVIGLRRAGMSGEERAELKTAFRLLYESGRNVSQALALAGERSWSEAADAFFEFVAGAKRRGICGTRRSRRTEEAE